MNEPRPTDAVLGDTRYPHQEYLSINDFDAEKLAALCKAKRGKRGFKDTKRDSGLRLGLLSIAEHLDDGCDAMPRRLHFEDFLALCKWLEISPAELVTSPALQEILAQSGPQPRPYDAVMGHPRR